jgi:hypothetical protein
LDNFTSFFPFRTLRLLFNVSVLSIIGGGLLATFEITLVLAHKEFLVRGSS